jgi:hypothetical protein
VDVDTPESRERGLERAAAKIAEWLYFGTSLEHDGAERFGVRSLVSARSCRLKLEACRRKSAACSVRPKIVRIASAWGRFGAP